MENYLRKISLQHHARTGKVAINASLHPLVEPLRRGRSNLEQLPPKFPAPQKFCRPKIPHPCPSSNQKSHRLPLPPTPGTADPHRSCCPSIRAPPLHPALPRPLTTSRPVESLLAAVRKREKKAQPNHQLATIPTRTPVAKTPQLTRPQVSSPSRTCPTTTSPCKNNPRAPKLTPIPVAPQTTRHTHTHTTYLRNARLVDADPSPAGGAVARARPARQRGASQREGQSCAPGPTPRNPSPATIDRYGQQLTSATVGLLPVQRHHQVLPRPRLRRRLLGAPVQAEGVAGICGRRVRRGAGVRGVQLEPEAGGEGD